MSNSPTSMFVGGFHHTNHHCEVGFELVKDRCYVPPESYPERTKPHREEHYLFDDINSG